MSASQTATTVLVLGATGKSGRRLVTQLAARGTAVRAASRQPGAGRTLFDWSRRETYAPALAGADAVYLVPPELVADPSPQVGAFLDAAKRAGVTRIALASSLGVEFPTEAPLSGRRTIERQVVASGLDWAILRLGGFAQNFSESFFLPGIVHASAVITAIGDGAVAYIDAGDIAAVAAALLAAPGRVANYYALTGPAALTSAEVAAIIGRAAGRPIAHRAVTLDEMAATLRGAGLPDDYAAIVLGDMASLRDGHGAQVTTAVESVLGRPPRAFADFAAEAAPAWRTPAQER